MLLMLLIRRRSFGEVLASCLLASVAIIPLCTYVYGSSIPIWEFLTRNEKISYLYSTFAQLVSIHCKATAATSSLPVNKCKHDLLNYGFNELQTFSDNQLDNIDPYQRGANELIWSIIMHDHADSILISTRKPIAIHETTFLAEKEQNPLSHLGQSSNSVAIIADEQNPIFDNDNDHKHQYAMDMDMAYGYPHMAYNPQSDVYDRSSSSSLQMGGKGAHKTYLTGPLVIRVKPDGTPVEEDKYKPIPQDDDLEVFGDTSGSDIANDYVDGNGDGDGNGNSNGNDYNTDSTITINGHTENIADRRQKYNNNKHRKIATISRLREWQIMREIEPMQRTTHELNQ